MPPYTIGEITALIPEASTADDASERLDGQSGDTDFPFARFKALATIGEVDPVTQQALTGYPDGNAAWLKDENTVRVAYQSESYATMSNQTYGWQMDSSVTFTGSHIHTIDYDRSKFADFLNNSDPASTMFKGSGHLFNTVYNVFGEEVTAKTSDPTDLAGKWGNQTNPDGTIVEFLPNRQLTEGDFFFHSFCGAHYEPTHKYGEGMGFEDDVWLMGEEWNIGDLMFADPDGAGPLRGFDVANQTMGLASMVVDIKNEVAYTAPALGQAGYEKLLPINPGHEDYVVIVASGYNHDINPAPMKLYVGRKGYGADGAPLDLMDPMLSERDRFLARNGLLYGQLYGMALDAQTYADLGISTVDADTKMLDAYLRDAAAPEQFEARYYPTSYRWDGFDSPEAVADTEVFRWAQDGDAKAGGAEANEQPLGYTYFNSDTKVEHSSVDPDASKFRFVQNHTRTGGLLGVEMADLAEEIAGNDADGNGLPDYLSAAVTRILSATDGALTLDVGSKGVGHFNATGNPSGATAEKHIELNNRKMNDPDGLLWIRSANADVLIVDEDSGNDYGERKYALVVDQDLNVLPDGTGYFLAQAGGNKNPRALAGAAAIPGNFSRATSSEFSGSWNVTPMVARKTDGSFYTMEELAGTGAAQVAQSLPLDQQVLIGVVQQPGESGGSVAATKSDQGGQLFMFSMDLPGLETPPAITTVGGDDATVSGARADRWVKGTAPANSTVDLVNSADQGLLGVATADANGAFSYRLTAANVQALGQGEQQIAARLQAPVSGSGASLPFALEVETLAASRARDELIGTSQMADTFVFGSFYTGVPHAGLRSYDTVANFGLGDRIDIRRFDDRVMGSATSRRITRVEGVAADLSIGAINQALGQGFTGFQAGAFQVAGMDGTFLAVNNGKGRFDSNDMLVFLEGFTPSAGMPLQLV
ncbi:MAG: calcium-binding protein [Cyanobacteriota bacterium]|nr:calcium-binding protein [Cyanobacteriota bacterium]